MNKLNVQKVIRDLRFKQNERLQIFRALSVNDQAQVIVMITRYLAYEILSRLNDGEVVAILENLDPDETTDIIQLFPKSKQSDLINNLSANIKGAVDVLMRFNPETAAGLMDIDYIQVDEEESIGEAAKRFKIHEQRTGRLPAILIIREGKLAGYLPGHQLGFGRPNEKVKKYLKKISTIPHNAKFDEVIELFRSHPHNKMAVLGDTEQVLGVIYSDDVLRLLREKTSRSLYDFAGVADEENVYDNAFKKVKFRYKWLIVNLATAFLASFTVRMFEGTISKYVLLAVYMPIVAGMGGNSATQTFAVMVRGIALKQINLKTSFRTLKNEVFSGLTNGVINGSLVLLIVYTLNRDVAIAIILASAMVINLIVASIFGTMIPLIMKHFGKDPASSASIFITTATDVLGFLAFLGLATIFLD